MARVVVDGDLALWTRTTGEGHEPLVIPGAVVDEDLAPLAEHRTVVFYDTRGRGRSDPVMDPRRLGFWRDVADTEMVRRAFALERAAWMGWSYLAGVVVRQALAGGVRVSRLVLVAPVGPASSLGGRWVVDAPPGGLAELDQLRAAGIDHSDPARFCRAWRTVYQPLQVVDPDALLASRSDPCVYPNEWPSQVTSTLAHVLVDLGHYDWRTEVAALDIPVLVVQGAQDSDLDAAQAWVDVLPDARLLMLDGVRRLPWLEAPTRFFAAVGTFLDGRWPDGCRR